MAVEYFKRNRVQSSHSYRGGYQTENMWKISNDNLISQVKGTMRLASARCDSAGVRTEVSAMISEAILSAYAMLCVCAFEVVHGHLIHFKTITLAFQTVN